MSNSTFLIIRGARLRIRSEKKKLLCLLLTAFIFFHTFHGAFAQTGLWTWMKGANTISSPGNFGTQGVADPANNPPAVYEPCEWTDHNGNFWLLGGDTYNCLWKFDPLTSEWTWMNGSSGPGQTGAYGVQGQFAASNHPGGRQAATSWVDNDGYLWLFGGYGYGATGFQAGLNDLWKYDVSTNEWAWIAGSTLGNALGVYGTQGVPDPANIPGGRLETAAAWVDSANNLWFFGGQLCCNAGGFIDDLWKYETTTGEWTWMKGATVSGAAPVYGTKGIPDILNTPGGRRIYAHWKDANGNFWLSGGQDNFQNCFNDLWKYSTTINEWTWISGSSTVNATGNFGTQCAFDSTNEPGARMENRFYWTDSCDNFWMFGGLNTNNGIYHNDLWCYSPALNQWKWVSGAATSNQFGYYGTQGVPDVSNHPGARYGGVGWVGPQESLWLFGGVGFQYNNNVGNLNDLWRFIPDSACVYCNILYLPSSALQSSDTSVCEKFCVDFFDQSTNNPTSWLWQFPGGIPSSSTDQNPVAICYNNPGTYDVTLVTTNSYGSDTLTLQNFITVYPTPPLPTITQNGYTLTSSPATSYQWQFNSVDIPGATNQSYDVQQSGYYTVFIKDQNGCSSSTTIYILIEGIEDLVSDENVLVYPNPSNGNFIVEWLNGLIADHTSVNVVNILGQIVFSSEEKISSPDWSAGLHSEKMEIDLTRDATCCVSTGVFFIEIKTEHDFFRKKIVIQK